MRKSVRSEVTEESFGALLIEGLSEARAIARGEAQPPARVRRQTTARNAEVKPLQAYAADKIQSIRREMGLSQQVFAQVLNASAETIKAWEQGKRQPDGTALALLEVAAKHPAVLMERVREIPRKPSRSRKSSRATSAKS